MNKHVAAGLMLACAVVAGAFVGPKLLEAQQKKSTSPHVIVIHDVLHVLSPRLGGMTPIPPAYGVRRMIPLRHPFPLQSRLAPAPTDLVLQTATEPLVATTSGLNFLGVGDGFANYPGDSVAPPDTNGSAGATQYVQWVNLDFAVFNKSNGDIEYGPALGSTLFQALGGTCASSNSGDIIAQYDKQAQRWVMMQPIFSSPYALCVAVSTTSDATGTYNEYQFSIPSNYFPDYPKLAVWPDGYYVSYNAFTSATGGFVSGYACALDRAAMIAGSSTTMQCFNSGGYPSLLPSDLDGDSGAPGTTAAPPSGAPNDYIDFSTTNALNIFQFHVDWNNSANSTFTGPVTLPVASFTEACGGGTCIPQEGTKQQLDSLGDRLMYRFAYRNFSASGYQSWVVSQSVDTGNGNTGIRWYELRDYGSGIEVYQDGTFAPDSNYRWMPSIAEDKVGDIALGYSVSSGTMYPAIRFTGRTPSDPLGTMESENAILQGAGAQDGGLSRWGDYSDMSIDPTNDCTFWYTNEFLGATGSFNWSTQIASFSFPGCTGSSTAGFSLSPSSGSETVTQGSSNTSNTINVTPSGGFTGNVSLSVTSPTTLPSGMSVSFSPNPVDITSTSAGSSTMTVTTTSSTPTGNVTLTITGTASTTSGTITSSTQVTIDVQAPATPSITLSSSPSSATVSQGSSTSYTISVTPGGGYTGTVNLSASNLPGSATATFNPPSVTISGTSVETSTLTLATTSSTPTGTYNFTVTGADTSGSPSGSIQLSVTVQAPTVSDFAISATPSTASAAPGSSTNYTVSVTGSPSGTFSGTVSLSVSGVPPRTGSSFSTTSITGSGNSTLTLSPHHNAKDGTYTLTITGISGSLSHSVQVTFIIGAAPSPSFTLAASPSSVTVTPGSAAGYSITVSPSGGFNSNVTLSTSTLPGGVSATFGSNPVSTSGGSASTSLSLATSTATTAGTYPITITGSGGGVTASTQVTLVVQSSGGSGDFTISVTPSSLTVGRKSSVAYIVTVGALNGFSGTVNLTLTGLPGRTSYSFSTSTIAGSGTSTLTITTSGNPPAGSYTLTVTGTSGTLSHSASASLTIT
jgi:uncharacterized membrane protein